MKITTVIRGNDTNGAWTDKAGVYVNVSEGVVIAETIESKASVGFILALGVQKDGEIVLQHDDNGTIKMAKVSPEAWQQAILDMLNGLKAKIKLVPTDETEEIK